MTNNKQQTAVEQFLNAIKDQILLSNEHLEMIESYADQCKEIEKERMIEFAQSYAVIHCMGDITKNADEYYNETYGDKK
jgi:hypothetical protein